MKEGWLDEEEDPLSEKENCDGSGFETRVERWIIRLVVDPCFKSKEILYTNEDEDHNSTRRKIHRKKGNRKRR